MARKKKIINNTPYPQHAIDVVARCLWPDIVDFWLFPIKNLENIQYLYYDSIRCFQRQINMADRQKEFEAWKRQQDKERVEQENQLKAA